MKVSIKVSGTANGAGARVILNNNNAESSEVPEGGEVGVEAQVVEVRELGLADGLPANPPASGD